MDIKHIAIAFVDAINNRDIDALNHLMERSCGFDIQHIAKALNFKITVERIIVDGDTVLLIGTAQGSCNLIPCIWKAEIHNGRVADWCNYSCGGITCLN